ncbi:uncharacterized protein LOC143856959 [Tasmannia lanceolata]|uniref:uncharacterized protein LOC143856959 n=1 Tax=Tasmannia lanceolata TaxID=3420 RepID=UPI004062CB96
MERKLEEMDHRIGLLMKGGTPVGNRLFSRKPPFTEEVLGASAPRRFKMPQLPQYDGTTDPIDHLETYKSLMLLHGASDGFLCRAFTTTLTGAARDWYSGLQPESISSFEESGDNLAHHFMSSRRQQRTATSLMTMKQEKAESLKDYINRFNRETLQSADFRLSIAKKTPSTLADLIARTEKCITAEETLTALNLNLGGQNDEKRKVRDEEKNGLGSALKLRCDERQPSRERSPLHREEEYTPLNIRRARILTAIQGEQFLTWPQNLQTPGDKRNKSKYCRFHKDHSHDTDECRHLKEEIENLLQIGYLKDYVKGGERPKNEHSM